MSLKSVRCHLFAADPLVRAFLNDSEELGLERLWQLADLVEEQRASVRQRERPVA